MCKCNINHSLAQLWSNVNVGQCKLVSKRLFGPQGWQWNSWSSRHSPPNATKRDNIEGGGSPTRWKRLPPYPYLSVAGNFSDLCRPDGASSVASSIRTRSHTKEALTFTSAQWKRAASTRLPPRSFHKPVSAPNPTGNAPRPSISWTLSFRLVAEEKYPNSSHGTLESVSLPR